MAVAGGDGGGTRDRAGGGAAVGNTPADGAAETDVVPIGPDAGAATGCGLAGPARPEGGVAGRGALAVAAVPRAAGIVDDGRGTVDEALRATAAGFGADGDSMAISTVNPTNPSRTAAMPESRRVLSDMPPDRPAGRE